MPAQALNLRVLSDETPSGSLELLTSKSQRYKTARAIIDLVFQLLERSDMRECLVATAQHIVIGLRGSKFESLWPLGRRGETSIPEMPSFIDFFLHQLRQDFPEVQLSRNLQGEAAVCLKAWAAEQESPTVYSWKGRDLGHMVLSRDIINCMVSTKNPTSYRSFMCQMIISTAHEIAHLLTAALTGGRYRSTPKKLNMGSGEGEAGFFFEVKAFGGITEFYASLSQPNDTRQPGIPYIFKGKGLNDLGMKLDEKTIQSFVEDISGIKLPLVPENISQFPNEQKFPGLEIVTLQNRVKLAEAYPKLNPSPRNINANLSIDSNLSNDLELGVEFIK
ncbi:hypothetical protein F5Y12DRAFT_717035 [Xylaria sp. FL1777]|nr:hypothetical protein F5Y12DRAFT_717035 [Xylaria sp. FL1777]